MWVLPHALFGLSRKDTRDVHIVKNVYIIYMYKFTKAFQHFKPNMLRCVGMSVCGCVCGVRVCMHIHHTLFTVHSHSCELWWFCYFCNCYFHSQIDVSGEMNNKTMFKWKCIYWEIWSYCTQQFRFIAVTSWWALWRLKSPALRLFTQQFIQVQIKEDIKAPRHWPLWWEFTSDQWIPPHRASSTENVSIWWRHRVKPAIRSVGNIGAMCLII